MEVVIIIVFVLILIYVIDCRGKEGLRSRPSLSQRRKIAADIYKNKNIFVSDSAHIRSIRNFMPWMDAILYEDVRHLLRTGQFNKENLENIIS